MNEIEMTNDTCEKKTSMQDRLGALGFTHAADKLKLLTERKRKMAIAYEHYRFVRPENIAKFNAKLHDTTRKDPDGYKHLALTSIQDYREFPPATVLDSMQLALDRKCFDAFKVAHIERVKDPILFGYVDGCVDAFFIDQWDNDVKIDDLLKANEG